MWLQLFRREQGSAGRYVKLIYTMAFVYHVLFVGKFELQILLSWENSITLVNSAILSDVLPGGGENGVN